MKQLSPDLFDGTPAAPAAQPLRRRSREAFCQLLAGEHFDNQTEAYHVAFKVEDRAACRAAASRLMRDPEVSARVAHLRETVRLTADSLQVDSSVLGKRGILLGQLQGLDHCKPTRWVHGFVVGPGPETFYLEGYLTAYSDEAEVHFGGCLEARELAWLRHLLLQRIRGLRQ